MLNWQKLDHFPYAYLSETLWNCGKWLTGALRLSRWTSVPIRNTTWPTAFQSQSGRWGYTGYRCLRFVFRALVLWPHSRQKWFHRLNLLRLVSMSKRGSFLTNREGEMATVTLSLHAKQPKRGTIAYDKGYIELYEYPRGQKRSSPIRKMDHKKWSKQEKPF